MRVTAALSRTDDAGVAAAEAADAAGADLDDATIDLAVVLASPEHTDGLASVAAVVDARLEPAVLLGGVAQGVIGPHEEVEAGAAVVVWCAHLGAGRAVGFRAWTVRPTRGGVAVAGWPDTRPGDVTVVLADPYSFPVAEVARHLGEQRPGQPIAGGLVTGGPDRTRLLLDGEVHPDGAVGVVLQEVPVATVVSQGCRPVGEPLTVTEADGTRILALAGAPAAERVRALLAAVDEADRELLEHGGLQLGLVVDEVRDDYRPGDFLVRGVLDLDPDEGSITVGDLVHVGQTVQFQVRDAASADEDLRRRLDGVGPAAGSLLFSCNGRGRGLFGEPDHDVRRVFQQLGGPVAGAFCAGELGPVGSRSHLHGYTASVVALDGRREPADHP